LQLPLNVTRGHASGREGDDLLIQPGQPRLAFLHQLRFKLRLPVTRHRDLHLAQFAFEAFLTVSIAGVAAGLAFALMFVIAQVRVAFGYQRWLDHRFAQFFEQAVFSQDVLWILCVFEQFIDQFSSDGHL
jgi:hypothetical protein